MRSRPRAHSPAPRARRIRSSSLGCGARLQRCQPEHLSPSRCSKRSSFCPGRRSSRATSSRSRQALEHGDDLVERSRTHAVARFVASARPASALPEASEPPAPRSPRRRGRSRRRAGAGTSRRGCRLRSRVSSSPFARAARAPTESSTRRTRRQARDWWTDYRRVEARSATVDRRLESFAASRSSTRARGSRRRLRPPPRR